jgi:hypothetical protein
MNRRGAWCVLAMCSFACSSPEPTGASASSSARPPPSTSALASAPSAPSASEPSRPPPEKGPPPAMADLPSLRMRAFQRPRGPASWSESYRFYPDVTIELQDKAFYLAEMSSWEIRSDHEMAFAKGWTCIDHNGSGRAWLNGFQRALVDVRGRIDGPYWCRVHLFEEAIMSRFAADNDIWARSSTVPWFEGVEPANVGVASTVVPWSEGRNLGLYRGKIIVTEGPTAHTPKLAEAPPACAGKTHVAPSEIAALSSGEVLAAGIACEQPGAYAIEAFAPGSEKGTFTALPKLEDLGTQQRIFLRAKSPELVVAVVASTKAQYVVRLEGGAWQASPLPKLEGVPIRSVSLASDGSVWLLLRDVDGDPADVALKPVVTKQYAVLRQDRRGAWARAELDVRKGAAPIVTSVTGLDADHAIVAGGLLDGGGGSGFFGPDGKILHGMIFDPPKEVTYVTKDWAVLWSTGAADPFPPPAPGPVKEIPPVVPAPEKAPEKMEPWSAGCTAPFIVMFQIAQLAPADYTYPATRDAMKDAPIAKKVTFIEYTDDGSGKDELLPRRWLGVRVKDKADGDAFIAQIKKGAKGMAPQLMCFEPKKVLRVLDF